ncbi:hypothetical protein OB2597_01787 [Pseudooceanicola batsensis HTCC2597]|uniref:Uncharacterized protein n=1 Tax=Pseudooceanicola batsensis (strain ATCC BAA-863 / DSM 15984 / KCTC 12145 / HTCC2597) TaxID=252305 RepID=A3TWV1_PSEBH|nr:hypothetical protein [Pseudooceanicola batsensis]EAQ03311.1 hypothetical protein OB2597_01787 [Pseudooceanicola batsensis HTCC2597]
MQLIQTGYSGMTLLVDLNRDRLYTLGMVGMALAGGYWIASLIH